MNLTVGQLIVWLVSRLGKTTSNISANDLMWEFFKRHPMK